MVAYTLCKYVQFLKKDPLLRCQSKFTLFVMLLVFINLMFIFTLYYYISLKLN